MIHVQVLTVYVAHDIQEQQEDHLTLDYLVQDAILREKGLSVETCKKALEDIGFSESQLMLPISAQSGAFLFQFWLAQVCLSRVLIVYIAHNIQAQGEGPHTRPPCPGPACQGGPEPRGV
jgi:hypothetical protein